MCLKHIGSLFIAFILKISIERVQMQGGSAPKTVVADQLEAQNRFLRQNNKGFTCRLRGIPI